MNFAKMVVVVPTLNEREGIERVIKGLLDIGIPKERIIVVDGHSTDGTPEIAMGMGVRVVFQDGFGKADAIKKGIEEAVRQHPDVEYIAFLDGDCTYSPSYLPALLDEASKGFDLVIGWRKCIEKGAMNIVYRFGNIVLTTVFNILFGCKLHDVLSGMYVVRIHVFRDFEFGSTGFSIESEIVAHVVSNGYRVSEIPIKYLRRCGNKKLKVFHGLRIFVDIIRFTWRYNPAFLIFITSSLMLIPGLGLGLYVAYHYFFTGVKYYVKGLVAIILTLAGFESLLLALLSLYIKRFELRIMRVLRRLFH